MTAVPQTVTRDDRIILIRTSQPFTHTPIKLLTLILKTVKLKIFRYSTVGGIIVHKRRYIL